MPTSIPVIETIEKNQGGAGQSINLTCNKPAGVEIGDLLVLICANEDDSAVPQFWDNKAGWEFIDESGDFSSDAHIGVFYRIATGTEDASETVVAESADQWCMFYARISGVNPDNPINISNFASTFSESVHVIPSIITDVDNCLILYGLSFDGSDGFPFSVAGPFVEEDEVQNPQSQGFNSACWGSRDLATAGASGAASVTCSLSDGAAYFQIGINPTPEFPIEIDGEDAGGTPWEFDSLYQQGGCTLTLDALAACHGNFGYKFTGDGSNKQAYGIKAFTAKAILHSRIYIKFPSTFTRQSASTVFFAYESLSGATYLSQVGFYCGATTHPESWALSTQFDGLQLPATNFSADAWHYIDIYFFAGSGADGVVRYLIDGDLAYEVTGMNYSAYAISLLRIGQRAFNSVPDAGDWIYIDDIVLAETGPIGPVPSPVTYKSLAGAFTFSGGLLKRSKVIRVGNIAFIGNVIKNTKIIRQGNLVCSGSVKKLTKKFFSGTLTFSGSIKRAIKKMLGGVIKFTGLLFGKGAREKVEVSGEFTHTIEVEGEFTHTIEVEGEILED